MKRISKILCLIIGIIALGGCFKRDNMEDINIYTSVYPIEYIMKSLYGNYSNITSIYPSEIDVYNYELTDKQIKDYAKGSLFVYNGLSDEKKIARSFINENKHMKIIDVSYGLSIEYGNTPEELWLSPNNFLMLATTTKNNLNDFISSKYIKDEINKNYAKIQEEVSIIDANLREIASSSKQKNKNIIITTTNTLKYLENYGFKVISLEDEKNVTNDLKNNFKNKTYKYLFIKAGEDSDLITELKADYKAEIVEVNMMNVLSSKNQENNENYISIMNNYLNDISNAVLN